MRTYKNISYDKNLEVIREMQRLSSPNVTVESYRNSFEKIGNVLGELLNNRHIENGAGTMLACASEDADWLAKGVIDSITQRNISLAVFWNDRITIDTKNKIEYSPIIRSYIEPVEDCGTLILVKSIISTSCVVKNQLLHLIGEINPKVIYIVAPVMYKDAQNSLLKEFPKYISDKFHFLTLAVDTIRNSSGEVLPGVGGMVYPRLGLGDIKEKNKYTPRLVLERLKTIKFCK